VSLVISDDLLVRRLRAGDPGAFELIHQRHEGRLRRYAASRLGSRRSLAEDVVQEVFERAHRALLRDERPITLEAWLYTLVRNRCVDELRTSRAAVLQLPAATGPGRGDPHERLARGDQLRVVLGRIMDLPPRQRTALVRTVFDGASHRCVARELGASVSAVKSLVARARAALLVEESQTAGVTAPAAKRPAPLGHEPATKAGGVPGIATEWSPAGSLKSTV
jgi:RNA polymerase sigma-70 factor, ECF subfamily